MVLLYALDEALLDVALSYDVLELHDVSEFGVKSTKNPPNNGQCSLMHKNRTFAARLW